MCETVVFKPGELGKIEFDLPIINVLTSKRIVLEKNRAFLVIDSQLAEDNQLVTYFILYDNAICRIITWTTTDLGNFLSRY